MCLKFKGYKNCLEATQLESKKDHKEFIKNNELILKCDKLWFQNRLTLIMLQKKSWNNTVQSAHKFLIIYTGY